MKSIHEITGIQGIRGLCDVIPVDGNVRLRNSDTPIVYPMVIQSRANVGGADEMDSTLLFSNLFQTEISGDYIYYLRSGLKPSTVGTMRRRIVRVNTTNFFDLDVNSCNMQEDTIDSSQGHYFPHLTGQFGRWRNGNQTLQGYTPSGFTYGAGSTSVVLNFGSPSFSGNGCQIASNMYAVISKKAASPYNPQVGVNIYSAGTTTEGALVDIATHNMNGFTVERLSDTALIVVYQRTSAPTGLHACVGTISGTTITLGAEVAVDVSCLSTYYYTIVPISDTKAIIFHNNSTGAPYSTYATVLTISGNTISAVATPVKLSKDNMNFGYNYRFACKLTDTKFVVVGGYGSYQTSLTVMKLDGTTISESKEMLIQDDVVAIAAPLVARINDTSCLVSVTTGSRDAYIIVSNL